MSLASFVLAAAVATAPSTEGPQPTAAAANEPMTTAVAEQAGTTGVVSYDPAFFAAAQPNTAMDMINRLPGFTFNGGDSNVRGYSGALGNVLIDGAPPASKSDPLEDTLRRMLASSVERIDVIRGGAPGIDMQGKPVIANVIRKKDTARTGMFAGVLIFHSDGRVLPQVRLEGSIRGNGRQLDGSVLAYRYVDDGAGEGPRTRVDGAGNLILDAHQDQTAGGIGVQPRAALVSPLGGGEIRANFSAKIETYDFELFDHDRISNIDEVNEDDFFEKGGELGATWLRKFGPKVELEAMLLQRLKWTDLESMFETQGFDALFTEDAFSGESIGRAILRYKPTDALSFEGGGEAAFNFLDSATTYAENGVPVDLPASDVRVEEKRAEAFLQATWRATPTLTLEAGSRFEVSEISTTGDTNGSQSFFYPKPRVQLTWSPNPGNQLRLRVQQEVGQLDFGDFVSEATFTAGTIDAGNPDLHPDRTWVAEASYEKRFWGKGAIVLTYRYKKIKDALDRAPIFTPQGVFDAPANIGSGSGHEGQMTLTLPLDKLGITGGLLRSSVLYRHIKVTDPTTGERRRVSRLEPWDADVKFSHDIPSMRLNWGLEAFLPEKETYYRFDEIRTNEFQTWVMAYVEYKPRPNLSLRAEVQNLLSRNFNRTREVYAGPRGSAPLAYFENRPLNFGPFVYLRVRRTFG